MKNIILAIVLAASALSLNAQTNTIVAPTVIETNAPSGKQAGSIEVTLGGAGVTNPKTGASSFGFDFSVSVNPFKRLPSLWLGVAQGLAWEPAFSGSTDVFTDWSIDIYNDTIYLNAGWSVGVVYDTVSSSAFRTGPELTLQYYTSDTAFVYAGVNYDLAINKGVDGLRYSFGIGLSFP